MTLLCLKRVLVFMTLIFDYETITTNVSKQEGKDLAFSPLPCKCSIFAFYLL